MSAPRSAAPASQQARHLHRGRAAVEDDRLLIVEKLCAPQADPGLFVGVAEGPHGVGGLLGGLAATPGSVHSRQSNRMFV